ncbi:beta strand repeat-containing protein [Liquorilactobacillus hordei]|nr:hypothetical protein [Liquorilactobacillus hordei]QYH51126.1 hypothetical protein G6O70_00780 [Liquorilactobacillus hordei DSM 19519]
MKKTIKYLSDGEYKYPTVKDVGDIEELKTTDKTDLVSAINDLAENGVPSGGISDKDMTVIDGKISEANTNLKSSLQANLDKTKSDLEKAQSSLDSEIKEVNTNATSNISDIKSDITKHNDNIATLNQKATDLDTGLNNTKKNLVTVQTDLANIKIGQNDLSQTVDTVKGELETKATKSSLDDAQEQIQKNIVDIKTNATAIENKASQESLDVLNGNVNDINSTLKQQAGLIDGKVSEDSLTNKLDSFQVKKANLLLGTRDWYQWSASDPAYVSVTNTMYNHCYWASFNKSTIKLSMSVDNLIVGNSYTLSVVAKTLKTGDTITVLADKIGVLKTQNGTTNVSTTPDIYFITFVATSTTMSIDFEMNGALSSGNSLYLNQAKLETGTKVTYWEMNSADNYQRIQHSEAELKITGNQISTMTSKQTQLGDKQESLSTAVSQIDDRLVIAQENITALNGNVTAANTKIDSKAGELQANFTKEINKQIDNISDSSSNQILNSSFTNNLNHWQAVNSKATITNDSNGKKWVNFQQSNLTSDSIISIESNYFAVSNNQNLVIAFDLIKKSTITLDNPTILVLEIFDKNNNRVDYKELSITDFDNGSNLQTNTETRLKYKYTISHSDAAKFAIKPELRRNGYLQFSNFFATISTISDGSYIANSQDSNEVSIIQQAQITANTNGLGLKASQTSVDTLNQTVSNHTSELSVLTDQMSQKTSKTDFDNLTGRVTSAEQKVTANADGLNSTVSKMSTLQDQVNNSAVGTNYILASGNYQSATDMQANPMGADSTGTWSYSYDSTNKAIIITKAKNNATIHLGWNLSQYLQANTKYTVTMKYKSTNARTASFQIAQSTNATSMPILAIPASSDFTIIKNTFTTQSPTDYNTFWFSSTDFDLNNYIEIAWVKIELGTTATDYSANPADNATVTAVTNVSQKADQIAADLATSNGDITQLKAKATGWDSSIASANGKINTLQATSDGYATNISKIQDQVNNSAVGTNLLLGTAEFNPWTGTTSFFGQGKLGLSITIEKDSDGDTAWHLSGTANGSGAVGAYNSQLAHNYPSSYAFSVSAKGTFANTYVANFLVEGNTTNTTSINMTSSYSRWTAIGTIGSGLGAAAVLYFHIQSGDTVDIWVKKWKLEVGSVATDWNANPNDNATVTSVTNAQNTAISQSKTYADNQISATASTLSANLSSTTTTLKTYADNSATTKANAVQNNLDNLQVGGNNLIPLGNISTAASTQTAYDSSTDIRTFTIANGAGGSWGGGIQNNASVKHEIPWNAYFTYSVEIMPLVSGLHWNSDTNSFPISGSNWNGNDNDTGRVVNDNTGTTDKTLIPNVWNKVWVTYRNASTANTNKLSLCDNSTVCVVNNSGNTVTVKFRHFQGEIGNKPTDWSLAVEDIQNYADAQANNAKNSAVSTAASDATTKANNAQNNAVSQSKTYTDTQISATAGTFNVKTSSIQTQLDNSAVGTNLLLGTGSSAVMTGANTSNQTASFYSLANGYNASKLATVYGTQFTISFDWSVSGTSPSGNITVQWNNVPWGISSVATVSSSNTSGHFTKAFGIGTQAANIANILGFRLDNFVGTLTVSNVKLEKGSVATDWSLAPTDTDYTNMFSMDSNGITLDAHGVNNSNKTILLRGDHVKIDSSNPVVIPSVSANVITTGVLKSKNQLTAFDLDNATITLNSNNAQKSNALLTDGSLSYKYTNFNNQVVTSSLGLNYASDWNNSHHLPDWLLAYQKAHNGAKVGELNIAGSDFINIHAGSTAEFTINNVADITKNHKYTIGEEQMAAVGSWVNTGNISFHDDDPAGVFKISKKAPATGKDQFISMGWYTEKWMGNQGSLPGNFENLNSYMYIASEGIMFSHTDPNIPLLSIGSENYTSDKVLLIAQGKGGMRIDGGAGSVNIDTVGGGHFLTTNGGDLIFGNNDGTGNVGLRGGIFYFDLKDNGTRILWADSNGLKVLSGGFTSTNSTTWLTNTRIDNELWVNGKLNVSGAKNAIVKTSKGWAQINAYETTEYYFGDLGKTDTGSGSKVKIVMDSLFLETVNTKVDYHVFVSSYGNGYAWVSEQNEDSFVIESNVPNLKISYEVKAKRKGYENTRLEIDGKFNEKFNME